MGLTPAQRDSGGSTAPDDKVEEAPPTLDEILQPAKQRELRRLPRLCAQALALVWEASPRHLLLAVALQVISGLALAAQLLMVKRLLDTLLQGESASFAAFAPELAVFAALFVLTGLTGLATSEQRRLLGQLVERLTTRKVMDVATTVDLLDFDRPAFYNRLERARVNASARPMQMTTGVLGLLNGTVAVIAVGATLVWLEPLVLGLMVLGFAPTWWANRVSARVLHAHAVRHTPGDRRRNYLYDILTRKIEAQEVRAFRSAKLLRDQYAALLDQKIADLRNVSLKRLVVGGIGVTASALVVAGTLVMLLLFVARGRLDLAAAGTAMGAVVILAGRLRAVVGSTSSLYEGALFLADFTEFLANAPHMAESAAADDQPDPPRQTDVPFKEITLHDVSFTYPSRSVPSIRGVSTSLRRGEVVAVVGENGSGKTTLAKMLAGLYLPGSGTLSWDEVPITQAEQPRVRDRTAVIFQDYARYFLTARENIAIGRPECAEDAARVEGAARRAGAHPFVADLPHGYDSLLGPAFAGGCDLSGGQWQRIALARAYFRDAPLLILDEPTASLDPRAEYEIFEHVRELAAGRTVVLISHRFSSARLADRILVLRHGELVEEGPHEALMARDGLYAELFLLQATSYGLLSGPRPPHPFTEQLLS